MIKLLWIDDNLDHDLADFRMALRMHGVISPDFARNATDAYAMLLKKKYDVVIVDLRMPPGPDDMWNSYYDAGEQKFGSVLLKLIHENADGKFDLNGTKFGVFSIEPDWENENLFNPPINLSREHFMVKTDVYDEDDFINFILKIHES